LGLEEKGSLRILPSNLSKFKTLGNTKLRLPIDKNLNKFNSMDDQKIKVQNMDS